VRKILLIDDSKTILKFLELEILEVLDNVQLLFATSFAEANKVIRDNREDISVAVVDLNLPDCKAGEAVLLTNAHKIPTIILSGSEDEDLKALLLKKDVLDFVQKDSKNSIQYVAGFVKKIIRNYGITAVVVDDSPVYRKSLRKDLEKLRINVIESNNGQDAIDIISSKKEVISLVITDYVMPKMDGIELTSILREKYDKDSLIILAFSTTENDELLAKFIKAGANDFIFKPHKFQELNVRINSNLDILDLFQKTKDLANRDYLTGSYNRRYFYDASEAIVAKNVRKKSAIAVATIDIDNFKIVNDSYGHDIGDIAIKEIAKVLDRTLRVSDLVARFGGEEYCILLEDISFENVQNVFEKIRKNFEENSIKIDDLNLQYTVSIGVGYGECGDIGKMIKVSDEALYEAKESGRNKVVIHSIK